MMDNELIYDISIMKSAVGEASDRLQMIRARIRLLEEAVAAEGPAGCGISGEREAEAPALRENTAEGARGAARSAVSEGIRDLYGICRSYEVMLLRLEAIANLYGMAEMEAEGLADFE